MWTDRLLAHGPALTFDDVLLVPRRSDVLPADCSTRTVLAAELSLPIPILSAAMDTVTSVQLAIALAQLGGLGVVHKNQPMAEQVKVIRRIKDTPVLSAQAAIDRNGELLAAAAVGTGPDGWARATQLVSSGVDLLVVDTAHGHSANVLKLVRQLRDKWPDLLVCAGNIATPLAAIELAGAGAQIVKVGVGPGSICTTRIVAGVGMPQLTAILECAEAAKSHGLSVIADGGMRYSGDIVKALAAGADAVMLGSLLAGTDEAPGNIIESGGQRRKTYRGMGSLGAMQDGSKDRYGQAGIDNGKLVPEGVEGEVAATGSLEGVIHQLVGGIRAGMGYVGAPTLSGLRAAQFVQITTAGIRESHVHDLAGVRASPNYRS